MISIKINAGALFYWKSHKYDDMPNIIASAGLDQSIDEC